MNRLTNVGQPEGPQQTQFGNLFQQLEAKMGQGGVDGLVQHLKETGSEAEGELASALEQIMTARQQEADSRMPPISDFLARFAASKISRSQDSQTSGKIFNTAGDAAIEFDVDAGTIVGRLGKSDGKVQGLIKDLSSDRLSELAHSVSNQILPGDTLDNGPWLKLENAISDVRFDEPKWVEAKHGDLPTIDASFLTGFEVKHSHAKDHNGVGVLTLTGPDDLTLNVYGAPSATLEKFTDRGRVRVPINLEDSATKSALETLVQKAGSDHRDRGIFNSVASELSDRPRP